MARYLQAAEGQLSWAIEDEPYTRQSPSTNPFGLLESEAEFPNVDPQEPLAAAGERRGPHVLSPEEKEYDLETEFAILNEILPLEAALGPKTVTLGVDPDATPASGDEYDEHKWTEGTRLSTATIEHAQAEDGTPLLQEWLFGCKADPSISASQGEKVLMTLGWLAAKKAEDRATPSVPALTNPQDKIPFRFSMLRPIDIDFTSDGSDLTTVNTPTDVDLSWDNGLEANFHGNGREAYSISEETGAEKYTHSMNIVVEDRDLWNHVFDEGALVDVPFVFARDAIGDPVTDALIINLKECKLTGAPIPYDTEGKIEAEIGIQPRDTEIIVRVPA